MPTRLRLLRPDPSGPRDGDTSVAPPGRLVGPGRAWPGARVVAGARARPELLGLLVLAAVLYLWALSRNGLANEYYAAAVRSMSSSWHAFLYGSLDQAGVMTVDKPPLALWVQALSARVFGFGSLSLLVPQALMGVAAVALVYDLVRRRFGRLAGFAGGLALALTPVTVAISRHNNPDALLVLCVIGAVWALVRGLEDGRTRWLILAGACVGLGFETKMGAALLIVPGLVAAWLWVAPRGRMAALRGLGAGGAAMVVVGGAWPLLVALTPAADRPWISGTSDNSIWSLMLGYNGFGRLDGQAGGPGGVGAPGGGMGGGGSMFGGDAGPLRLLNSALGGQAGWLLGVALVGGIGLLVATRLHRRDARTGWLLAVGGAALTCAVAFSFAQGIFHPYYVSELAPFAAALVGAAAALALRRDRFARVLAPAAVAAGAVTELVVLHHSGTLGWLPGLLTAGALIGAGALAWLVDARGRRIALAAVLGLLLFAPATWAVQTLGHATAGTFPAGGPESAGGFGGPGGRPGGFARGGFARGGAPAGALRRGGPPGAGAAGPVPGGASGTVRGPGGFRAGAARGGATGGGMFGQGGRALSSTLSYIARHGGGALAVSSQSSAASSILSSHANVVGIGGFSGRESEVSASWLAQEVRTGKIRWMLVESAGGFGGGRRDGRVGATKAEAAVAKAGRKARTTSAGTLYDLRGRADALAAAG